MDPNDGGFTSRKFILCVVSIGAIVVLGILAGTVMTGIAGLFTQIIGGILGAVSIYSTGNIAAQYVVAKASTTPVPPKPSKAVVKPIVEEGS
jgi:hypothetical protein